MNQLARLKAEICIQEAAKKLLKEQPMLRNSRTGDHLDHVLDVRVALGNLTTTLKKSNAPGHWSVAAVVVNCVAALAPIRNENVHKAIQDLVAAHSALAVEHERAGLEVRALPDSETPRALARTPTLMRGPRSSHS